VSAAPNLENVPAELRELDRWVAHRGKVPHRPDGSGRPASTTDPSTWGSFEDALAEVEAGRAEGIGFVFAEGDGLAGFDLDACVGEDGELCPEAARIVADLASYAELSPSRTGVHAIVRAELNGHRNRTAETPWGAGNLEAYGHGRYFTVTGRRLPDAPASIEERQAEADAVCAEYLAKREPASNGARPSAAADVPPEVDDDEILRRAFAAKNGQKVERLWSNGNDDCGHDSPSEADLALVGCLAFWTGPDPAGLDRLFRRSARMRPKWDERRGDSTYGADTIAKHLEGRTEFHDWSRERKVNPAAADSDRYAVTWTEDKTPKLVLPPVPDHDDTAGQCGWLTSVLNLDPAHPVTGAEHQGVRGSEGHVVIHRAGAKAIRIEPAEILSAARRLLPKLPWLLIPTDGEPYGFKDDHARQIAHVVRQLCGASAGLDADEETLGIVNAFLYRAQSLEGFTTYGTSGQRYETAEALRRDEDPHTGRPRGPYRCLVDSETGEVVIRVGDLQAVAREHIGSSLARGWLDARMTGIGWRRLRLDGHALTGRTGRSGPHARVDVYRGHLLAGDDADGESVTT
jgi:putative DNA primase/helicase